MPRFEGNQVTVSGGALVLSDHARLETDRAAFINNGPVFDAVGVRGGALYLTDSSGFTMQGAAVPPDCPHGPLCPRFLGNQADEGALASVGGSSTIALNGALVADNTGPGTSLVRFSGFRGNAILTNSFLVRNRVSQIVSGSPIEGTASFRHNTIADNTDLESVLLVENGIRNVRFSNNLVMEDDIPIFSGSGPILNETWECHVGSSAQTMPFDREVVIDNPDFVDPGNLDYHLGPDSGAIDVCGELDFNSTTIDIDHEPRPVDHSSEQGERIADAGADEVQAPVEQPDIVFSDRFEGVRL